MSSEAIGYMVRPGFIYVMQQQGNSEYYKIGHTKDVADRQKRLDTTGVPIRPVVLWQDYVSDPPAVERESHRRLAEYRVRSNREWFQLDPALAIKTVIEVSAPYTLSIRHALARIDITSRLQARFGSAIKEDLHQASIIHTESGVILETIRRNAYRDAFITHRVLNLPEEDRQTGADFRTAVTAEDHAELLLNLDTTTLRVLHGDLTDEVP